MSVLLRDNVIGNTPYPRRKGPLIRRTIATAESIVVVVLRADSGVRVGIKVDLVEVDVHGVRRTSCGSKEARTSVGRRVRGDGEF